MKKRQEGKMERGLEGLLPLNPNVTKNCVFSLRMNSKAEKHKSARSRLGLCFSPLEWTLAS